MYPCLSELWSNSHRAKGFVRECAMLGHCTTRPQISIGPSVPGKTLNKDALQKTFDILSNSACGWSFNVLWEIRSGLLVWVRDCVEQDRFNIWVSGNYVKQLWEQFRKKGSFALASMCSKWHLVPKQNYTWFLARRQGRNKKTGTQIRCAFWNQMSKPTCLDCVVTMQYGQETWNPVLGTEKESTATLGRWSGQAAILWTGQPKLWAGGAVNTLTQDKLWSVTTLKSM